MIILRSIQTKQENIGGKTKKLGFKLTDFEKKLANLLSISHQTLTDTANDVMTHLLTNIKANKGPTINGRVIRQAIGDRSRGNERMHIMKLFKPASEYTIDEVRDGIVLRKFESECHVAGENDLLIVLPDSKLILSIQIKRHMKFNDDIKSASGIDRNMLSASTQLKKNAQFISSKHGAILSSDWRFVKVCAISPFVYNMDSICSNCKKFILTADVVKASGGLEK